MVGVDLAGLTLVIEIGGPDGAAAEVKPAVHGVQFRLGVAAIGRAVPALELVTEHQHVGQRMIGGGQRDAALLLIASDAEFIETVVKQYGGQRV